jgi:hypothetical protein
MPLKVDSKYPNRRAYVVKLQAEARPHVLAGRIENLVSGRQLEFTSGIDLLNCLARDLLEQMNETPVDDTGDGR